MSKKHSKKSPEFVKKTHDQAASVFVTTVRKPTHKRREGWAPETTSYTFVEGETEEQRRRLNRAFDVLFEEVLKNRRKSNTKAYPKRSIDTYRQLRVY